MNSPHFSATSRPLARRGSTLPPSHVRIIAERKPELSPMAVAVAVAGGMPVNRAEWRRQQILTDPIDAFAVAYKVS